MKKFTKEFKDTLRLLNKEVHPLIKVWMLVVPVFPYLMSQHEYNLQDWLFSIILYYVVLSVAVIGTVAVLAYLFSRRK